MAGEIFHQEIYYKISVMVMLYHYLVELINKTCCHDDYDDEGCGNEDEITEEVTSKL